MGGVAEFLDLNPQKYVDNIFNATPEDFVKAEHKPYRSEQYPSSIHYSVLTN